MPRISRWHGTSFICCKQGHRMQRGQLPPAHAARRAAHRRGPCADQRSRRHRRMRARPAARRLPAQLPAAAQLPPRWRRPSASAFLPSAAPPGPADAPPPPFPSPPCKKEKYNIWILHYTVSQKCGPSRVFSSSRAIILRSWHHPKYHSTIACNNSKIVFGRYTCRAKPPLYFTTKAMHMPGDVVAQIRALPQTLRIACSTAQGIKMAHR